MVKVAPLAIATGLVMLYGLWAVVQVESENIMPVTFVGVCATPKLMLLIIDKLLITKIIIKVNANFFTVSTYYLTTLK